MPILSNYWQGVAAVGPHNIAGLEGAVEVLAVTRVEFALAPAVFTALAIVAGAPGVGDVQVTYPDNKYNVATFTFNAGDVPTATCIYLIQYHTFRSRHE